MDFLTDGRMLIRFGLWIWSNAPTFGACPETNASLQLVVLGKSVGPLGGIRIFILVLCEIILRLSFIMHMLTLLCERLLLGHDIPHRWLSGRP